MAKVSHMIKPTVSEKELPSEKTKSRGMLIGALNALSQPEGPFMD